MKTIIPAREVVVHLIHTANFHLNQLLHFFNPDDVLHRLASHAVPSLANAAEAPFTVSGAQTLAIIAVGKLLQEKNGQQSSFPGDREFWTVEYRMPAAPDMLKHPVIAAETLCMLAWYAEAINRSDLASLHVSEFFLFPSDEPQLTKSRYARSDRR